MLPLKPRTPVLLGLALLLVAASPALAHGPPAVRDQDVRLLADHNDDCGGHGGTDPDRCDGSHDLVALDVREAHDGTHGDLLYLRLVVQKGSGSLRDVITLTVNGQAKTFEVRTTDNKAYTGTGFDTAVTANPVLVNNSPDGDRMVVEGGVKLSTLGGAGAKLTAFKVDAYNTQGERHDYMPGGYVNGLGVDNPDPSQGDGQTNFVATRGYTMRGPTYYAELAPASGAVASDGQATVNLQVKNLLRNTAQTATLVLQGDEGVTAEWSRGGQSIDVALGKGATGTAALRLAGDGNPPGTGSLTVVVTTNLGGRSVHEVPYEVTAAGSTPTQPATDDEGGDRGDEGAPAPAALLLGLLLVALAALRRRT